MEEIIRQPNEIDRAYIGDDGTKVFKFIGEPEDSPEAKYRKEVGKKFADALKNGLPFCDRAAVQDFKEYYETEKRKILKKYGEIKIEYLKEIKPFKTDLNEYSNLKNFELVKEYEQIDKDLIKRNPGLHVTRIVKTYQFKGRPFLDIIMEPEAESIQRARKKVN